MNKYLKYILLSLGGLLLLVVLIPLAVGLIIWMRADYRCPENEVDLSSYPLTIQTDSLRCSGPDCILLNDSGLWEAYLSGSPEERGARYGVMAQDLLWYQEKVFVDQIRNIIPSETYIRFLHRLITLFNWNMASHVPEEYREEIHAVAASCSHEFDAFGSPYERQLNYHAAHDIGHAMQQYMLVGCTSFAVWREKSVDSTLLVGRNFDFYMGDDFARHHILLFVSPDEGYRFASISWPGMMGVVSGMNEKGLCVTINAAKGPIPTSSATPISILVRQMLQYASDIDSALEIARNCQTFVSESILVGSAADSMAVIIEKSPDQTALYRPEGSQVLCTNHFQSECFTNDSYNQENIQLSDSPYRLERLSELVQASVPMDPASAATVLRDYRGKDGRNIGLTNQKSINPCIAHHSVIFEPQHLRFWVSTYPWQSGAYLCYDLKEAFGNAGSPALRNPHGQRAFLPADSLFLSEQYPAVLEYRSGCRNIRKVIEEKKTLDDAFIRDFILSNPEYFGTYDLLGDYFLSQGKHSEALRCWNMALEKEIPTIPEENQIREKVHRYE